jgi:hypothetical protein
MGKQSRGLPCDLILGPIRMLSAQPRGVEVTMAAGLIASWCEDIRLNSPGPASGSLCHQQVALIFDTESSFRQMEVSVQVDNSPADVAVRGISGHRHEFIRGA